METKNYMEIVVESELENMLKKYPDVCKCRKCRNDIMAIALNHLPPKYYNTNTGYMFLYNDINCDDDYTDMALKALKNAINVVAANPKHNENDVIDFLMK